jgi:hypothetical protein
VSPTFARTPGALVCVRFERFYSTFNVIVVCCAVPLEGVAVTVTV